MTEKILVINPGSTSTKIAVFEGESCAFQKTLRHSVQELEAFGSTFGQLDFRIEAVRQALKEAGIEEDAFDCVMARGGGIPGLQTGGYEVNQAIMEAAKNRPLLDHASNLGASMALPFAENSGCKAYIYDAVSADVLSPLAKVSGFAGMQRTSLCHVLNARAVAMEYAKSMGKDYSRVNLVVAHLGGGITVSAHEKGRMVDALRDDEGPMSPTRCGGMAAMDVVDACFAEGASYEEMAGKVRGNAGLTALCGTQNAFEIEERIAAGDQEAKRCYEAMAYQIAKCCAMMSACFTEKTDAVILTGGLAHSKLLTEAIKAHLSHTFRVEVIPGEMEMEALAYGGLRILRGEEAPNPAYQ